MSLAMDIISAECRVEIYEGTDLILIPLFKGLDALAICLEIQLHLGLSGYSLWIIRLAGSRW